MKRLLVVLLLLLGSVLLGYPANAAVGAEGEVEPATGESFELDTSSSPAPAEADDAVVELAETPETTAPAPSVAEEAPAAASEPATVVEDQAAAAPSPAPVAQKVAAEGGDGFVVAAAPPEKVFVCKYVGQPGVDERLKAGKQPISVSSASTGGAAVGNFFADGQDRSYVVAIDDGGPAPTAAACPLAAVATVVAPEPPSSALPRVTSPAR